MQIGWYILASHSLGQSSTASTKARLVCMFPHLHGSLNWERAHTDASVTTFVSCCIYLKVPVFNISHQLVSVRSVTLSWFPLLEHSNLDSAADNCCCEAAEILRADTGCEWHDLNRGPDCCRLIEACQFSAEDVGFLVATLSPSLRHIPTASTHLPRINRTA